MTFFEPGELITDRRPDLTAETKRQEEMIKGNEKVTMPRYITVEGTAYMRADLAHRMEEALKYYRDSRPQCECKSPDCEMSRARDMADNALAAARGEG